MKRSVDMTDEEWNASLADRKRLAERRMKTKDQMRGFLELTEIIEAAAIWGVSQHEAEQRLMRGELVPEAGGLT